MNNAPTLQLKPSWLGQDHVAARVQLQRARDVRIPALQALALANVASFEDGWVFRKTIAKHLGCSVKTVQRGLNRGKKEGLCGIARAKPGEKPRGWKGQEPPWCGFSHRWMTARDAVGEAARAAIAWAKATALARAATAATTAVARRVLERKREQSAEQLEQRRALLRAQAAELVAAERESPD